MKSLDVITICAVLMTSLCGPVFAEQTLQGRVTQDAVLPPACGLQGSVVDTQSGRALAGAVVSLPDSGETVWTDGAGKFCLSGQLRGQSAILNINKAGYVPFSLSVTQNQSMPFKVRLQQLAKELVLDNTLHHLGDGGFSALSQHAGRFRKQAEGPALRIRFTLGSMTLGQAPKLKLGSLIGVDTAMAHFVTQSNIGVSASPVVVKLNQVQIATIQVNGDNQRLHIPAGLLAHEGENVLEIEAGSHVTDEGRLDYDDLELMTLILEP